jgi:hypothetical protein
MRIRVEITEGDRKEAREYEGKDTHWKYEVLQKIIEFLQTALGIAPTAEPERDLKYEEMVSDLGKRELTLRERLEWFLKVECPKGWYSSMQIKTKYEQAFHERINLSTVSTYLARMHRDGILERRGSRKQREYRVLPAEAVSLETL